MKNPELLQIRKEQLGDYDAVREINRVTFEQDTESRIVDKIRDACEECLSLVAAIDGKLVGHILFSPVSLESKEGLNSGMGLGPMAVLPDYQKQGIGSSLVKEGLRLLKNAQVPFVIVLGHPSYYPRFGFEKAKNYALFPQWQGIPDEAFMVLFFDESLKGKIRGIVKYRAEFDEAL